MNKIFIRNKKGITPILAVLAVIALLMVGGAITYSVVKSSQNQEKLINILASQKAQPSQQLSVIGQPLSTVTQTTGLSPAQACAASAGFQKGDTVSTAITVFDKESSTAGATISPGLQVMKKQDGTYTRVYSMTSFSSAQTLARPAAGDIVAFYGGNTSASTAILVDASGDFCLDSRTPTVNLNGHSVITPGQASITVYNELKNLLELSAGYNLSQEDYVLTLTSNDKGHVTLQVQNNGSNKLWPLKAFAAGRVGNISNIEYNGIVGASANLQAYLDAYSKANGKSLAFEPVGCPQNITNTKINLDLSSTTFATTSTYGVGCWGVPGSDYLPLHQTDFVKLSFTVSTSDDPTDNNVSSTKSLAQWMFLDGGWAENTANEPQFDFYTHNTNKDANVGNLENLTAPYGKTTGVTIEGI